MGDVNYGTAETAYTQRRMRNLCYCTSPPKVHIGKNVTQSVIPLSWNGSEELKKRVRKVCYSDFFFPLSPNHYSKEVYWKVNSIKKASN